jgi:hypothetical protein
MPALERAHEKVDTGFLRKTRDDKEIEQAF